MTVRKNAALAPALAALLLPLTATPAQADHGNDSASGHVRIFGAYELDFSARSSAFGTDSRGRARLTLTNSDPNQVYSGDVVCLRVVAATATTPSTAVVGVRITDAPFGNIAQGMLITAVDTGKFSQQVDAAGFTTTLAPPTQDACPTPSFTSPVEGEVTIHNTFP